LISDTASAWMPRPVSFPSWAAHVVLVELADDGAVAGRALGHLDGVLQRGQRLGLGPDDPAGQPARHEGPGDLQHLAEALRGDQADGGALALQDRVGRHRGAVQHLGDLAQLDPGFRADLADPGQHADGLVGRGGGGLGPPGGAAGLLDQQHVGEGAADVDTEPVGHGSLLSLPDRAHHRRARVVDVGGHQRPPPTPGRRAQRGDDLDVVGQAAAQRGRVVGVEVAQHDRGVHRAGQRGRHRRVVGQARPAGRGTRG
jgi:hypothetical protein